MTVSKSITKKIGMILLAIWLILTGLIPLFHISFHYLGEGMCILAIAAGVLILLDK